ncbi:MAG: hypothetical protein VX519_04170 [Myxococcota bacterium]|nr:hypothetical protein [Myxococcota bacterium]
MSTTTLLPRLWSGNSPEVLRPTRPTALKLSLFFCVAGLTVPLWGSSSLLYGALVQDTAQASWLYDFIARGLLERGDVSKLSEFNHPQPLIRADYVPDIWDIALFAPIAWLFDFPRQFGVVQALVIGINTLGCAWLARVCGCRGVGIFLAGWLGATHPTAFEEIYVHRMNAAMPGAAACALAAWINAMQRHKDKPWQIVGRAGVAGSLGALAALTYPPFLLLLAPIGIVLALPILQQAPRKTLCIGLGSLAWGLLIAAPFLVQISSSAWLQRADCDAMDWGACSLSSSAALDSFRTLSIFHMGFSPQDWLGDIIHPLTWILAPLALLHSSRIRWMICLCFAVLLAAFSLGPCLVEFPGVQNTWCKLAMLHDVRRFSTMALVITAVATGVGIESAWKQKATLLKGLSIGASLGIFTLCGQTVTDKLSDPNRWLDGRPLPSADFLIQAEPGPVAELPYDSFHQFLSAIHAPNRARTNPYHKEDPHSNDPFLFWLHALGTGQPVPRPPTADEARASGVRWVLFEPQRCTPPSILGPTVCGESVPQQIQQILGPAQQHPSGLLTWSVP